MGEVYVSMGEAGVLHAYIHLTHENLVNVLGRFGFYNLIGIYFHSHLTQWRPGEDDSMILGVIQLA